MTYRHWFITGVSSGLGKALALAALAAGDTVAGSVRTEAAKHIFEALDPTNAKAYVMDVTDHGSVSAAIAMADDDIGGIDILVNNAGYSFIGTLEESDWAEIRGLFEANLFGPLAVIKAALPGMRLRRRGVIVNVTSTAGYGTGAGVGLYAGTKLGLEGISKGLQQELLPFGIDVMIVVPGAYRTELGTNRRLAPDIVADYAQQNSVRRERLSAFSGHQRGDPAKAAALILQAATSGNVPRYLALGPDAMDAISADLASITAELKEWELSARSTNL